jgi:hypothetical protein
MRKEERMQGRRRGEKEIFRSIRVLVMHALGDREIECVSFV